TAFGDAYSATPMAMTISLFTRGPAMLLRETRRLRKSPPRFIRPELTQLEDRNAASDTLHALLGNLGVSFPLNPLASDSFDSPSLLSALGSNDLVSPLNCDATSVALASPAAWSPNDPAFRPPDSMTLDDQSRSAPSVSEPFDFGIRDRAPAFDGSLISTFGATQQGASPNLGDLGQTSAPSTTPRESSTAPPMFPQSSALTSNPVAPPIPVQSPNPSDGNPGETPDTKQVHAATLRSNSDGSSITVEALNGLTLSNIRAIEAPAANARNVNLPLGLFGFDVHGMAPGGAATVRLALPEGSALNHYFKQDSTGALQRFDFDGSTGAEFNGNVVTLHFVDGGRGDADGVANGVVVDPGGPGEIPLPYVRLKVLDPTAAKYRVDDVHGTSTGAFA